MDNPPFISPSFPSDDETPHHIHPFMLLHPQIMLPPSSSSSSSSSSTSDTSSTPSPTLHHPLPTLSQFSIDSQSSITSHLSLISQASTLGFLPSLASFLSDSNAVSGGSAAAHHRCVVTIRSSHVSSLVVIGDYLYGSTSGDASNIRIWKKENLAECGEFGGGFGAVKALVVAGDKILSAHQDHKIRIWQRGATRAAASSRQRPKQVAEGDGHSLQDCSPMQELQVVGIDHVYKLLASMPTVKDYLKSFIAPKNYVQVRRHHKRLWIEHVDNISMLAIGGTAADPLLYSASWDRTIKVWRLSDFSCVESFKAHDDAINSLLVSPDGSFLYTASADAKIKVWGRPEKLKKEKHTMVVTLNAHRSAVNALALSSQEDGGEKLAQKRPVFLYSGGGDKAIVVWQRDQQSVEHMVAAGALRGHRHTVLCLSSVGNMLCSGSADRTVRVWRRSMDIGGQSVHHCVAVLEGHRGPVKCLSMARDGAEDMLVYSSSLDHVVKLWWVAGSSANSNVEAVMAEDNQLSAANLALWKFQSI